jgi:hypothetical protein
MTSLITLIRDGKSVRNNSPPDDGRATSPKLIFIFIFKKVLFCKIQSMKGLIKAFGMSAPQMGRIPESCHDYWKDIQ